MISLHRIVFVLMVGLALQIAIPPAMAANLDGTWKVSRTGYGCTPTGIIRIHVKRGKVSGSYRGGTGKHILSGKVASSGSFSFRGRSRETVLFRGKISGAKGRGTWNVRGRDCGGKLRIYR